VPRAIARGKDARVGACCYLGLSMATAGLLPIDFLAAAKVAAFRLSHRGLRGG
jgi:hypothetical protein